MKYLPYILLFFTVALGAMVPPPAVHEERVQDVSAEQTHWLTLSSGVRHNSTCRWFKNSKGRMCGPDEGRACKVCGG
jgi:hypothetical protein